MNERAVGQQLPRASGIVPHAFGADVNLKAIGGFHSLPNLRPHVGEEIHAIHCEL